jgi:WD40 repeat protein
MKILGTPDSVYQTTAISPDCYTVVLVTPADFIVYDVSPLTEPTVLCWGETSGRHAPSPKPLSHLKNIDHPYRLAALTHDILAIASVESVDIRNAKTGERIKQLMIPGDVSRAISFSPNGQYLAIGLDNGDIIVYHAGLLFDFPAPPIRVPRSGKSPVASIAFSHDSLIMAVCTKDNIVRVYRLENLSKGGFRKYVEPLSHGKRSNPDIADIALYDPSTPC